MKISYVCADRGIPLLGTKGAAVHLRAITTALSARGHDVHVLCARLGDGNPPPHIASIRECGTDRDLSDALCELHASDGLDAVLERYSLESGTARCTSTDLGIPLTLEVNAPLVLEAARWRGLTDVTGNLAREQQVFETADAVIVVSRALAHYVNTAAPHTPTHWIPNGADLDRLAALTRPHRRGHPLSDVVVGFTGSMKRWHGLHELLDAFAIVHDLHLNSVLVLAGTGPEEHALQQRVNTDARLRDCVRFVGAVPHGDIPALLATFDIGVAPYLASEDSTSRRSKSWNTSARVYRSCTRASVTFTSSSRTRALPTTPTTAPGSRPRSN